MEERSLKVLANDTTFFSKISNTITKMLIPTKIGINGMMINIKRSNTLKMYEALKELEQSDDVTKKENIQKVIYFSNYEKEIFTTVAPFGCNFCECTESVFAFVGTSSRW